MLRNILTAALAMAFSGFAAFGSGITANDLRCCNIKSPQGIEQPSLGWKISSSGQTAWEVMISTSPRVSSGNVWKSGKVEGDAQFGIVPSGAQLKSSTTYYWKVRLWDSEGKAGSWSKAASFQTGILNEGDWQGCWISVDWDKCGSMPYLRKEFRVKGRVLRATAFVCGLGASDLFVNGEYADESRVLDPAQTNYEQYALYSAIDVTRLVRTGSNCIGVMLYDGWYNQNTVFADFSYGKPMLRAMLVIEYANGSRDVIPTDETWQWKAGPVVKANIYSGEIYDARLEVKDWCVPGSSSDGWNSAVRNDSDIELRSQVMPPMRTKDVLDAVKLWKTARGTWIYDFGRNSTSNIRLDVQLPAGTHLVVRTAEEKYPDGDSLDFRSTGSAVVPIQTEEYYCKGSGREVWMPRGTFHGFRYAELSVSDPSVIPDEDWLKAVNVHSDIPVIGSFECSNPQLNRLHELAFRTLQGGLVGVPVDCPTREKCGWLGDAHSYIKMEMMNFDVENFLFKYMDDIESGAAPELKNTLFHLRKNAIFYYTDKPSGIPFMIAPGKRLCGVASPDWGTAVVQLPWHLYLYEGSRLALEKYYPFMKQWTDHITSTAVGHIVYEGLGDWCPPAGNDTPVEFTSTAFHYYDLSIMEQVAKVLGKNDDEKAFREEKDAVKEAVIAKFYNPVLKSYDTQTATAMALDFGLCPEGDEKAAAAAIVSELRFSDSFLNTGIFGISRIGSALCRNGQADAALNIFTKKGEHSFEWMWKKYDATTLWETLPVSDASAKAAQAASHCHPMQSGYDRWFYEDLAGIRPVVEAPGFKKILLQPSFVNLDYVKASVETRYGTIRSEWHRDGNDVEWTFSVPAGCTATVALPDGTTKVYPAGDHSVSLNLAQ